MVGAFTAISGLLKPEAVKESVIDSVPKKFIDLNTKAFDRGFEAGKDALKNLQ
jgi:Pyruvate/2-oxoacid:ferredoxin oxidoreductase gamma subunit